MNLTFGEGSCDDLRELGWSVAVHNDYMQRDEKYTFWLMTYSAEQGMYLSLKGEGKFDSVALDQIRQQVVDNGFGYKGELNYLPQIEYLQRALTAEKETVSRQKAEIETLVAFQERNKQ